MSVAWGRLTKAPEAGWPMQNAASSGRNPGLAATRATDTTNRTPPPNISALRSQTSPKTPTAGSNTWPTTAGIASSTPIWRIRQTHVRANQGPSRLTGAVYELIEQRDR